KKAVDALNKTKRKLDDEIEFFNDAVDDLNGAIESFPGSMIAEYVKADSLAHYEENTEDDDSES
ncbi:MAG: LemA family protein, partial [Rickettsiales bacterium]|nr:LemA family protein [Rickettsiales bacterium]